MPSNPLAGFVVDRSPDRARGARSAAPGMHPRRARRHAVVGRCARRRGAHRGRRQPALHRPACQRSASPRSAADGGAAMEAKYTQGTLPNGLAFAANGDILIANFGTDLLEVMSRDGAHAHAARPHRRPAHRQGQLRAARLEASACGSPCPPASTPGRRRPRAACATATSPCSTSTACAWWPRASTSPTNCGSMPASSGCTSSRPPARTSAACGWSKARAA